MGEPLNPYNMGGKRPLSTTLDEDQPDPQEGWTLVESKRARRAAQDHSSSSIQSGLYTQATNQQQTKRLPKFQVITACPTSNYSIVRAIEKAHPDLAITVRPNLQGRFTITPKTQEAVDILRSRGPGLLRELDPSLKPNKTVVKRYPLHLPLAHLTKGIPQITEATRMLSKSNNPTLSVLVHYQGPVPKSFNLGIWGEFLTEKFHPEPLRCRNCQKFGHHSSRCTAIIKCAMCSGRHDTEECLAKYKAGETIQAKCPNCQKAHHAWNKGCQERLNRIRGRAQQRTTPQSSARNKSRSRNPPAAKPQTPAAGRQTPARQASLKRVSMAPKPQRVPKTPRSHKTPKVGNSTAPPKKPNKESKDSTSAHKKSTAPKGVPQGNTNPKTPPRSSTPKSPQRAEPLPRENNPSTGPVNREITISLETLNQMFANLAASLAGMIGVQLDQGLVRDAITNVMGVAIQNQNQNPPKEINSSEMSLFELLDEIVPE